jgi:8-oxo-dGTP pyrophosphatase MutT (NUDIX family)
MARFAPGSIVFPGGAIDAADATLAERWFGSSNEAPRACAVRELVEEAGLLLSADGVVEAAGLPVGWASPPGVDRLCEIGRWIAPEFLETRFDARFYAAWCLADVRPTPDGTEADAAWWARADEILERHRDGTVLLAWPTFTMLGAIATCQAVEDVLRLRVPQVPPPVPSHVAPRPV